MNPLFRIDFSISDSLKIVRKSVLIYETIIERLPLSHQYFFACRYSLSQGKIWPHRTVHLTKLPQGKKSIADHIRPGLFMDLDTDALHFQTDRGRM